MVAASSYHEDFNLDIDLWVNHNSLSIKAPKKWYPNLCLEFYSKHRNGGLYASWFIESKADYLALLQPDDSLTFYDFSLLRSFVSTPTVKAIPYTGLSPQLVTKNRNTVSPSGKPYAFIDCLNKNVPLNLLTNCEVKLDGY